MNIHLTTKLIAQRPIVFVGDYLKVIKHLMSDYTEFLQPKVIWVEYQVVPIATITKSLQNEPHITRQLFFLELPTLKTLEQLLRSSELFSIAQHGFSTIIITIPHYCVLPHDIQIRFQELVKEINVILIMDRLLLARTQIKLVYVESET